MAIYCFIDTCFFLEYQSIQSVKWVELFGTDDVTIVVPIAMLRELDNHKDSNPRKGKRERALKVIQLIENAPTAPEVQQLENGSNLLVMTTRPSKDIFATLNLLPTKPDDELVVAAYQFKVDHPADRVVVVTADTTPRVIARGNGLEAPAPPGHWKFKEPEDEMSKKVRNLEALVGKQPELEIALDNNTKQIAHTIVTFADSETLIARSVSIMKKRFPMVNYNSDLMAFNPEGARSYNRDIERFYKNYEKALVDWLKIKVSNARTVPISVILSNTGRATAQHVQLSIQIKGNANFLEHIYSELKLPKPPRRPSLADAFHQKPTVFFIGFNSDYRTAEGIADPNLAGSKIFEKKIVFNYPRIQHGESIHIGPIRLLLPEDSNAKGLQLDCSLKSDEQETKSVKLAVKLSYQETEPPWNDPQSGVIL